MILIEFFILIHALYKFGIYSCFVIVYHLVKACTVRLGKSGTSHRNLYKNQNIFEASFGSEYKIFGHIYLFIWYENLNLFTENPLEPISNIYVRISNKTRFYLRNVEIFSI